MALYVPVIDGMDSCEAADIMTWAQSLIMSEGVLAVGSTRLNVTQADTPAMKVEVKEGSCFVLREAYVDDDNTQKYWMVTNTAETEVNIDSNSSGSTRIDAICVKIDTSAIPDDDASNVATLVAVKGTPGAGNPTIPDDHLLLAYVSVEDGETTILNADITDSRVFVGKSIPTVSSEASSATPTIDTDAVDMHVITALATNITSFTTNLSGTPANGQKLIIRIQDSGSGQTIAWGASFESAGATLPTTITAGKKAYIGLMYNSADSKWDCVAAIEEA